MPDIVAKPVHNPGGYLTEHVVALANGDGMGAPVALENPLPVMLTAAAAATTPLAGETEESLVAGPFVPALARPIWLSLSGDWTGTVTVKRSLDDGMTLLPLTVGGQSWASYAANANEPIGEESVAGASYWLDIALNSGTIAYRVQQ